MNIISQQKRLSRKSKTLFIITTLWIYLLAPLASAHADTSMACSTAVSRANTALQAQGDKAIQDEKALTVLLQTLNRDDVLPSSYVTTAQAKKLGWNGNDNSSLWEIWALNKKSIGGDPIQNSALPKSARWYSADIESARGFRSVKRLIYSADDQSRYLTTNTYRSMVKITPCQ